MPDDDRPASSNALLCVQLAMPEGPVALLDGSIALVEMGESRKSLSIVSPDGSHRILCRHGGNPNGLAIDGDGCFWVAGGPDQSIMRIAPDGELLMQITGDGERGFLFPNDLAFGPDGLLYATDSGIDPARMFSQPAGSRLRDLDYDGSVYRIDPRAGKVVTKLAAGLNFTNGIAFGPDGDLYFNETLTGIVYRMTDDGAIERHANVIRSPSDDFKGPDGMAFAADGTLYCAVLNEGHICVVAPDGTIADRLPTNGELPTNVAFDIERDRIYVTELSGGSIEIIPIDRPGLALHAPSLTL